MPLLPGENTRIETLVLLAPSCAEAATALSAFVACPFAGGVTDFRRVGPLRCNIGCTALFPSEFYHTPILSLPLFRAPSGLFSPGGYSSSSPAQDESSSRRRS